MADEPRYLGGQAVVEGVMMRGRSTWAVAVRRPDGEIEVRVEDVPGWSERWRPVPIVRGVVALAESMTLGLRALTWSAGIASDEERPMTRKQAVVTATLSIAFFSAVFLVLPAVVTKALWDSGGGRGSHLTEGVIRLLLFLGYLVAIGRVGDIARVFQYHGAEHKAIAAYENGVELTPARAQQFGTEHVRCGTNFLLVVLALTIVVHSFFGQPSWAWLVASRVLPIPIVAGVSYELIKLGAGHMQRRLARVLMRPGLALQRLTTRQPTLDQLEVAIASLRAVLSAEELAEVDGRAPAPSSSSRATAPPRLNPALG